MPNRRQFLLSVAASTALPAWLGGVAHATHHAAYPVTFPDAEWRKRLTPQQFAVLRGKSTEYPYTSPLLKEHRKGNFVCAADGHLLFASSTKFDSGTGWPSFYRPLPLAIGTSTDRELGYERTEVHCAQCGGHLGHVFDDGPPPTGLRYCINGVAMKFVPAA